MRVWSARGNSLAGVLGRAQGAVGTAQPAVGQDAEGVPRGRAAHWAAVWAGVWALTGLVAAGYTVFALAQYDTFRTSSYDLVIFDQAVRSYAHFRPGIAIIKGLESGFGPNFSVLGDHWSPAIAVLAPLYWIYDGPQTLLVTQAVLFALAIPPLWLFTRRTFGGHRGGKTAITAAYLVSAGYALSWPIASALGFDFHEVAFVPVLTAVALERLQAGRLRTALLALAALLLVKEDMGLLVAGIGIYLAVARPRVVRRQLPVGLCLIVTGVAAAAISVYVLIPAFGGTSDYYWAYTALGQDFPQAVLHIVAHPLSTLTLLITPRVKLVTMLWLFGAFCFLPLRSPLALATIPLLLERMLANLPQDQTWWGTADQYNAFLVMVLVCAAVDGAARLDRSLLTGRQPADRGEGPAGAERPRVVGLACAAAISLAGVILLPMFAFGPALHPSFYVRNAQESAAAAADAVVPAGVTVAAVDNLGPQLSARDTVLLWDGDQYTPPLAAPWVVANVSQIQFSFPSVTAQVQRVTLLEHNRYRVVFSRDGYIVLHRPGPPLLSPRPPPGSGSDADSRPGTAPGSATGTSSKENQE